jgi:putative membrane protein
MRALTISTALLLCACQQSSPPAENMAANDMAVETINETEALPAMTAQDFANKAAASDMFEIESSKAALATSSSDSVKKFAQMMVDAHTKSSADLKAALASADPAVTPSATLDPAQQASLDSLKSAPAAAFDAAYKTAQVDGHQQALAMLQQYAAGGQAGPAKDFAAKMVPIVTEHLRMAQELK